LFAQRRGTDEEAKKRRRDMFNTVRCSKCKQLGHNKGGCRQFVNEPYKRKKKPPTGNPIGRPKKVQLPSSTITSSSTHVPGTGIRNLATPTKVIR